MDWIKDVNNARELLDEEYQQVIDSIGMDALIKLIQLFDKTPLYLSLERFDRVRRAYILQNKKINIKELSKKLGVSDRYIYNVLREGNYTPDNQLKIDI